MKDVFIVDGIRTAIGDIGGALRTTHPSKFDEHVMREVMSRSNVQPNQINKVIFGTCFSPLEQNIARNAAF